MNRSFQFKTRIQARLYEFAGMLFIGFGMVLLLTNLLQTPLYDLLETRTRQQVAGIDPVSPPAIFLGSMGLVMLLPAFVAMATGYAITKQYIPRQTPLFVGIMVLEMLVESILLGWFMFSQDIPAIIPSAAWGILTARWLYYFLGPAGSLGVLGGAWILCIRLKKGLRRNLDRPGWQYRFSLKVR